MSGLGKDASFLHNGPPPLLLVLLLCATTIGPLIIEVPSASAVPVTNPFVDENGLMWAKAVMVTNNSYEDQFPSLRLGPDGNAQIVYLEGGTDYIWSEVSPPSNVVVKGKRLQTGYIPTQYQIKNESTPQPTEFFDVGADGSLHIIWTEGGLLDNRYQRFDPEGEPVSGIIPMNQITDLSRLPYIGVGKNGRAYIAFENEGTAWVQMTYVDEQNYLYAPALIGRPGENIAFAVGADGNIHLFYRSLGANVNIFHVKLDPDRKPIVPNGILFSNKSLVANPYSSMPTISITPNGHVHLIMSNTTIAPHPIYYIELDEDGTPVMDFIKITDAAYGYGDIIGEPDNGAYVAWDDIENGEVNYLHISGGVPGNAIVVSQTGGKARQPQIWSDGVRGDIHLVYVDNSEEDGEIVYRYANSPRIGLELDRGNISSVQRIHPGAGTVRFDFDLGNFGDIPVFVNLAKRIDYTGSQSDDWSLSLEKDSVALGPGETKRLYGDLRVPANGSIGDFIDVEVTATPSIAPLKARSIGFRSTLAVNHEVRLSGPARWGLKDNIGQIPLQLSNLGDIDETFDISVDGGLPGWKMAVLPDILTVAAGKGESILLKVTLPDDVAKDSVAPVSIRAVSRTVGGRSDLLEIDITAYPSVFPIIINGTTELEVEPGAVGVANITLRNDGMLEGNFKIDTYIKSSQGVWSVYPITPFVRIRPGGSGTIGLSFRAPKDALAGNRLYLDLVTREETYNALQKAQLVVHVREVTGLTASGGGSAMVLPGETASFPVTIENYGNSERDIVLSVLPLPADWRWQYGDNLGTSLISLPPYSHSELELFITPPMDATPTVETVQAVITSHLLDSSVWTYKFNPIVTVRSVYEVEIDSYYPIAKAELGSYASFNLSLTNLGTGDDEYTLLLGELPAGVQAKFIRSPDQVVSTVNVAGRSKENVTLKITIPDRLKEHDFGFWVGARSDKAGTVGMDLIIELRLADLRIKDIVFDEKDLKDGNVRKTKVIIANNGDAPAKGLVITLNGKTSAIDVAAGIEVEVYFNVTFHSDDRAIIAIVDPLNAIQEKREDNNDFITEIKVQKGFELVPGFQLMLPFMAIGVAVVLSTVKSRMVRELDR